MPSQSIDREADGYRIAMKSFLKATIKDCVSVTYQLVGRPHNKTRYQIARAKTAFTPAQIDALRLQQIAQATGKNEATIADYIRELTESMPAAFDDKSEVGRWRTYRTDMMGLADRLSLGALVRAGGFATYVETGVGAGASATMILQQIVRQEHGRLISIDVESLVSSKYGALIPAELRAYWELRLQKDAPLLPLVLSELGQLDFFLHDSRHVVSHMKWEYELAWRHLRSGGCLASHDIIMTTAFQDFRRRYAHEIQAGGEIGSFGFYVKK